MKYLPLILSNLTRHRKRTILTIVSVALALFLFASLQTVVTTIAYASKFGSATRLVTTNATGFVLPLPIAYANRLEALDGVEQVTWANWFGGKYGDGKRFFATFAIDPESYLALYPEITVPPEQKQAFLRERNAALVGVRLQEVFGWQLGQNITIRGDIYPGDWTFVIRGFYTPTDKAVGEDVVMFHHAYLEEKTGRPGLAGWYILKIDDPANAPRISATIDGMFKNSASATKTATEQAFNASFATMWGNIGLLMGTIGLAIVFAILLVTANTMMMSIRERTREVAILKTLGFGDRAIFGLVMLEAGLIAGIGAVIGLGGAKLLYGVTGWNAGGFLPGFEVTGRTLLIGAGITLLLMLASGIVPALRAARMPVIQALRGAE